MTPHPLIGIIDDTKEYREALDRLLRSAGYRTIAFESADTFIGSTRNNEPQCLLVDHWMPGTTGLQLAYRLTRLNHSAPFIMLSIAADDIREAALTAGAVAVFSKCVSADVLIEAIQIALESRGAPNGFKATQ